jgi:hypothetical protein
MNIEIFKNKRKERKREIKWLKKCKFAEIVEDLQQRSFVQSVNQQIFQQAGKV